MTLSAGIAKLQRDCQRGQQSIRRSMQLVLLRTSLNSVALNSVARAVGEWLEISATQDCMERFTAGQTACVTNTTAIRKPTVQRYPTRYAYTSISSKQQLAFRARALPILPAWASAAREGFCQLNKELYRDPDLKLLHILHNGLRYLQRLCVNSPELNVA